MNQSIDWDKINKKKRKAAERRFQRINSPEYKANEAEKRRAAQERQRAKAIARQSDPEYRQSQIDKARAAEQQRREKNLAIINYPKHTDGIAKRQISKKSKGLKGRTPTAAERRLMDQIGALPCVCCMLKGAESLSNHRHGPVSLHHVYGRTKPWAHAMVLPLCQHHHNVMPPAGAPGWLFPLHHGPGRRTWEAENGTQDALLELVYSIIQVTQPWLDVA